MQRYRGYQRVEPGVGAQGGQHPGKHPDAHRNGTGSPGTSYSDKNTSKTTTSITGIAAIKRRSK